MIFTKVRIMILSATALTYGIPLVAKAQVCRPNVQESTPASRFKVNINGTVLDQRTGLTWKQCPEGLSGPDCAVGTPTYIAWNSALALAAKSEFAGHNDWRLPNLKELRSLVEVKCYEPTINQAVFPNTPSYGFWTSSPYAHRKYDTWYVRFSDGASMMETRGFHYAVRLVRGGP